ncbi:MAG: cytochrome C oxidase subunit IV family protein [Rhodocyclales bacterium]|nr:cytochrome C oxidase subunit IV family protein [Rhodocyclales bacterium]
MNARQLDLIFAALVIGTGITWWLGETGHAGPAAVVAILAIAAVKGMLIIRDFMALRGIGFFWPAMVMGWLLLVQGIILATYWKGH